MIMISCLIGFLNPLFIFCAVYSMSKHLKIVHVFCMIEMKDEMSS